MSADLERIGDEGKHIADAVRRIVPSEVGSELKGVLRQIIDEIKQMISETTACLSRLDHISALEIIAHDKVINKGYAEIYAEMVELMKQQPAKIDSALEIIWTARSIERIGDHCRNIAEAVIFVVKGIDVRHPPSSGSGSTAVKLPETSAASSPATATTEGADAPAEPEVEGSSAESEEGGDPEKPAEGDAPAKT